MKLKSSINSQT